MTTRDEKAIAFVRALRMRGRKPRFGHRAEQLASKNFGNSLSLKIKAYQGRRFK